MGATGHLSARQNFVDFRVFRGQKLLPELNPLSQRQVIRPVDRIGLPTHVDLPRIATGLAPATGFFFATKSTANLSAAGSDVHVRDPTIRTRR